uniref:Uncharacterized protein n=1 Tax=Anopheles farauti TaxID=69004 RepID=A0A182QUA9_9DIPT
MFRAQADDHHGDDDDHSEFSIPPISLPRLGLLIFSIGLTRLTRKMMGRARKEIEMPTGRSWQSSERTIFNFIRCIRRKFAANSHAAKGTEPNSLKRARQSPRLDLAGPCSNRNGHFWLAMIPNECIQRDGLQLLPGNARMWNGENGASGASSPPSFVFHRMVINYAFGAYEIDHSRAAHRQRQRSPPHQYRLPVSFIVGGVVRDHRD